MLLGKLAIDTEPCAGAVPTMPMPNPVWQLSTLSVCDAPWATDMLREGQSADGGLV